ncbi:MAG TPA: hypothetical protein VMT76_01185 [Puia sp.]|nr:hypothetical protein [Puia sp.]
MGYNTGLIIGKITDSYGNPLSDKSVALNHVGQIWRPVPTYSNRGLFHTNSNGIFGLTFGWSGTDIAKVIEDQVGDTGVPYQLNIFQDSADSTFGLVTRVLGESARADSEHVYNEAAYLIQCVDMGAVFNGAGPPPPFDSVLTVAGIWTEIRAIPFGGYLQAGGLMKPSPEMYALLSFISISI